MKALLLWSKERAKFLFALIPEFLLMGKLHIGWRVENVCDLLLLFIAEASSLFF